jgi:hypothetical protein
MEKVISTLDKGFSAMENGRSPSGLIKPAAKVPRKLKRICVFAGVLKDFHVRPVVEFG